MIDTKILLVSDDPHDQKIICGALGRGELHTCVVVARDGAEALDYLFGRGAFAGRDVGDLPLFVLLDLSPDRVAGIEVLRAIRADLGTRRLRVVVLAASADHSDIADAYAGGATSYVVKPWDADEFAETVDLLGRYWALTNQAPLA